MDEIRFEWDSIKAQLNLAKHGVSFEEATTIFYDDKALLLSDPEHSDLNEDRFLMLGMSFIFCLYAIVIVKMMLLELFQQEKLQKMKENITEGNYERGI